MPALAASSTRIAKKFLAIRATLKIRALIEISLRRKRVAGIRISMPPDAFAPPAFPRLSLRR
jgi:hypothetical protein